MKPQPMVVPFWSPEEVEAAINGTLAHLAAGKVLAYPTETVYGFGGAVDEDSVQQLVKLKGRAPGKPFLLLVAASEMITRLGLRLTGYASMFAARFWPGPLTLVLPGGEKRVPDRLRGPEGGVAVRWTPHRSLARLIIAHGEPITSTSANRPGVPPAISADRGWPIGTLFSRTARPQAMRTSFGTSPTTYPMSAGRYGRGYSPKTAIFRPARPTSSARIGIRSRADSASRSLQLLSIAPEDCRA